METEIITVQPTEADLKILQNVATKALTATFGPYHDSAEVKKYTDEAYALEKCVKNYSTLIVELIF